MYCNAVTRNEWATTKWWVKVNILGWVFVFGYDSHLHNTDRNREPSEQTPETREFTFGSCKPNIGAFRRNLGIDVEKQRCCNATPWVLGGTVEPTFRTFCVGEWGHLFSLSLPTRQGEMWFESALWWARDPYDVICALHRQKQILRHSVKSTLTTLLSYSCRLNWNASGLVSNMHHIKAHLETVTLPIIQKKSYPTPRPIRVSIHIAIIKGDPGAVQASASSNNTSKSKLLQISECNWFWIG